MSEMHKNKQIKWSTLYVKINLSKTPINNFGT